MSNQQQEMDSQKIDSRQTNSISILMLPWLAHGHISPFLELAKKLITRKFHIFFCSTPVNLDFIKRKLAESYSPCIEFVELNLPHDDLPDLPPQYHTTNGLPPHLMPTLLTAFRMACSNSNFSNLLKTLNPDFLIYDIVIRWAPSLALDQNIPSIQFSPCGAAATSFFFHYLLRSSTEFPFPAIYLLDHELTKCKSALDMPASNYSKDDGAPAVQQSSSSDRSCDFILLKTSIEIEGKYVDYLSELINKKIVPVGPLVQDPKSQDEDKEESDIIKRLNTREKSSAVYVSFGTEYFLSKQEIEELAHGLELSNVSFIWVMRFPKEEKITKAEELLPEGFSERVGERGMIVEGWAPQGKILQHSSIGGCVSHCGWSSVLESIKFGVPIIAIPMHLDQPINARLIEEVGVGVEVKRTGGGGLQREEVAKVIRDVMVEKNIGEGARRKAVELRDNMEKKEHKEIAGLVEELVRLGTRSSLVKVA